MLRGCVDAVQSIQLGGLQGKKLAQSNRFRDASSLRSCFRNSVTRQGTPVRRILQGIISRFLLGLSKVFLKLTDLLFCMSLSVTGVSHRVVHGVVHGCPIDHPGSPRRMSVFGTPVADCSRRLRMRAGPLGRVALRPGGQGRHTLFRLGAGPSSSCCRTCAGTRCCTCPIDIGGVFVEHSLLWAGPQGLSPCPRGLGLPRWAFHLGPAPQCRSCPGLCPY